MNSYHEFFKRYYRDVHVEERNPLEDMKQDSEENEVTRKEDLIWWFLHLLPSRYKGEGRKIRGKNLDNCDRIIACSAINPSHVIQLRPILIAFN